MEEENNKQTPAFEIGLFIGLIVFIIVLNQLPFPSDYGFWQLAGITAVTCIIVGIIYGITTELVSAIFKIFVEVAAVLLLLADAIYVASSWAMLDNVKIYFNLETWPTLLVLAIILFVSNILAVFMLYPLSKIAGTKLIE